MVIGCGVGGGFVGEFGTCVGPGRGGGEGARTRATWRVGVSGEEGWEGVLGRHGYLVVAVVVLLVLVVLVQVMVVIRRGPVVEGFEVMGC